VSMSQDHSKGIAESLERQNEDFFRKEFPKQWLHRQKRYTWKGLVKQLEKERGR